VSRPSSIGADRVVECHGPRAAEPAFDLAPGDRLTVGDGDAPLEARVVKRDRDRCRAGPTGRRLPSPDRPDW
jgi:hypothetical protein